MNEPQDAVTDGDINDCYDVMAELRPHVQREAFLPTVRAMEPDGFRLAFIREDGRVVAVAGYRVSTNLFYGKHLYVDDLVTADSRALEGPWPRAARLAARARGRERLRRLPSRFRRAAQARPRLLSARRDGALELSLQREVPESVMPPRALTAASLEAGARALARRDPGTCAPCSGRTACRRCGAGARDSAR